MVIETLRAAGGFSILGILDAQRSIGEKIEGVSVVGRDGDMRKIFKDGVRFAFITVGSVGDTTVRRQLAESLLECGFQFPTILHSSAQIAASAKIAPGTFVAAGVVIQPGVRIGMHTIVNTGAIIDHDCIIGDFVHIAPGAVLSGGVEVGDDTHLGTGSRVIESRSIGRGCLVGAGSVVVEDLPDSCRAFGNPCRIQEKRNQ